MTAFTDALVAAAQKELARWNDGRGRETADPFAGYVGKYWSVGVKNAHIDGRTTYSNSRGKLYRPAWSSAFISFLHRVAGAGGEFFYHEGHIHYVVKAIRDAAVASPTARFLGRDPRGYAPRLGDLINAGRGASKGVTYDTVLAGYGPKAVPDGHFMASHTDVVVSVDRERRVLRTIGGNVAVDTVGMKRWALNADGTLVDGPALICVIECLL